MTLEEQAIEQYINKPVRQSGSGGCCCVGPRPIHDFVMEQEPYTVEVTENEYRSKLIIAVHKKFDISMSQAKEMVDTKKVGFDNPYICKRFTEELKEKNIHTNIMKNPTGVLPECTCRMDKVVLVEGNYYRVEKEVTPNEVKFEVTLLGPIGGPYQNIDWYQI